MKRKCIMKRVIAVAALLATGRLTAKPQTNAAATASVPTQVIILGTLHGSHKANTNYSLDVLRDVIVAMKPAAILVELPPEIGGRSTVHNGRVTKDFGGDENTAANLAADALGVNIIPYDRKGRNEIYQRTRYSSRQKAANERLQNWLEVQTQKESGSIQVLTSRLLSDAVAAQSRFDGSGGPELINSAAYDMVIATKHGIAYGIIPKLLVASGERELSEEFLFIADEWEERNRTMARNILEIARKFAGKRLVVLTGSEHRYLLRELLAKAPELELKEFYQVPGWTQSARPTQ
jgi:hypothetical protein